ncbi:NAD-dependent epimerase/dehydratase family protein [Bordetella tumulicola]|uniref:NAD-dependent epimerase/dehydratase family protein n=1 Tax=Bordetella tumulicola TaxID=1649133 RepID=UPI0039EDF451
MTRRVLLAGCGDLGLRLAHRLLADGAEVWALRRHPPVDERQVSSSTSPARIHWLQGDLTRPDTLSGLPPGITHLAYLPAPGARDPAVYRAVFQEGLPALLAALDDTALSRILFVSSSAVYGEHHGDWVTETTPADPLGFNGRILLDTETWLAAQPISSVSLRLAGLYGPGRLQLIDRLRAGSARAPQHPPHWANRIHIDDAAAAAFHLLGLSQPDAVYIGCDDTPLPLHVLYAHLAEQVGAAAPADGPAPAMVGSKRLSNARLRASGLTLQWPDSRAGYAALLR